MRRPLSVCEIVVGLPAPAAANPSNTTTALTHAMRARMADYVSRIEWLVKN
jgi:hypothetical protein